MNGGLKLSGTPKDLERMIHVNKLLSNISEGNAELDKLKALQRRRDQLKRGEATICVLEGDSPEGEHMVYFFFADAPEAEGVAVPKADIDSGAVTFEQAIKQCCLQLNETK